MAEPTLEQNKALRNAVIREYNASGRMADAETTERTIQNRMDQVIQFANTQPDFDKTIGDVTKQINEKATAREKENKERQNEYNRQNPEQLENAPKAAGAEPQSPNLGQFTKSPEAMESARKAGENAKKEINDPEIQGLMMEENNARKFYIDGKGNPLSGDALKKQINKEREEQGKEPRYKDGKDVLMEAAQRRLGTLEETGRREPEARNIPQPAPDMGGENNRPQSEKPFDPVSYSEKPMSPEEFAKTMPKHDGLLPKPDLTALNDLAPKSGGGQVMGKSGLGA